MSDSSYSSEIDDCIFERVKHEGLVDQLQSRNKSLDDENQRLTRELARLEERNKDVEHLIRKFRSAKQEIKDLKFRLNEASNHLQEQKSRFEQAETRLRTEYLVQEQQYKTTIANCESQKQEIMGYLGSAQREISEVQQKYETDIAYVTNQDKMILSAATNFFGLCFDSMEGLYHYFQHNHLPVNTTPDRTAEINHLKSKIKEMKRKMQKSTAANDKAMQEERERADQFVNQAKRQLHEKDVEMRMAKEQYEMQIDEVKRQIPKRRKFFKFIGPSVTIMGDNKPFEKYLPTEGAEKEVIQALNQKIEQLSSENRIVKAELSSKNRELVTAESERVQLRNELASMEQRVSNHKTAMANFKTNVEHNSNSLLRSAREKILKQKESITGLESDIKRLNKQIEGLHQSASAKDAQIVRLEAQLLHNESADIHSPPSSCVHSVPRHLIMESDTFPETESTVSWQHLIPTDLDPSTAAELKQICSSSALSQPNKMQLIIRKLCDLVRDANDRFERDHRDLEDLEKFFSEISMTVFGYKVTLTALLAKSSLRTEIMDRLKSASRAADDTPLLAEIEKLRRKLGAARSTSKEKSVAISEKDAMVESMNHEIDRLRQKVAVLKSGLRASEARNCAEGGDCSNNYEDLVHKLKRRCHSQRKALGSLDE